MTSEHRHRCLHNTGSRPTYTQHMFVCLCIFWFRVRLHCES